MESRLLATFFDQLSLNAIKADVSIPIIFLLGGSAYSALRAAVAKDGIALANGNWNVLSTIGGVLWGYFYWGEALNAKHFMGIGLGCVSLYLMNGVE